MGKIIDCQDYGMYKAEDQETWRKLIARQDALDDSNICKEYLRGFADLKLDKNGIIRISELSKRLETISGWTLIPVTGLIPTKDFFYMLTNRKYPVTVHIRRPDELDFSEQPDIFHDICGHLPLLTSEKFIKYLSTYCIIALKYVNNERAVELLGRLYWYTYEMGIIMEDGHPKAYGGAIITSAEERKNIDNPATPKHLFDIRKIFASPYNPYKLQKEYFTIHSFDQLFEDLNHLEERLIEFLLLPEEDHVLRNFPLNSRIGKGFNNVIGFLNDIQTRYPSAISFAAGQPDEDFFDVESQLSRFSVYADHISAKNGEPRTRAINRIGQYSSTKGIINDIVANYLRIDENINVRPEDILITVGAQEAFAVIVATICNRDNDVVLVEDPSYAGLSSFMRVFDFDVEGVGVNEDGIDLVELKNRIIELNRKDKRVRLLYVIADYQNPCGHCMPIGNRLKLLELARQYNFLIIEDSVYNSFTYLQKKTPTLKSLDRFKKVIYVGSFAKSLFPGLRVGLIAADQQVENDVGIPVPLSDEMVKVKAQITNNTSTVCQAILGGILLDQNFSLSESNRLKVMSYEQKRNRMLGSLETYVGRYRETWAAEISWNEPDGGFFIKMNLPVEIGIHDVSECAAVYGVIFAPMRYFYLNGGGERAIRLTFSNLSPDNIEKGVMQLSEYLKRKITGAIAQAGLKSESAGIAEITL